MIFLDNKDNDKDKPMTMEELEAKISELTKENLTLKTSFDSTKSELETTKKDLINSRLVAGKLVSQIGVETHKEDKSDSDKEKDDEFDWKKDLKDKLELDIKNKVI